MKITGVLVIVLGVLSLCGSVHAAETPNPRTMPAQTWSREGEFLIDTVIGGFNQYNPSVAFDGTNYLVAWEDDRITYGGIGFTLVSATGTVLITPFIFGVAFDYGCSVAFDGNNYLLVYAQGGLSSNAVLGVLVSQQGLFCSGLINLGFGVVSEPEHFPSVAFGGDNYLVIGSTGSGIQGKRVSPAGVVLDPTPINIAVPGNHSPSVAFDGTNYLAVWQCSRNDSCDIYGTRVSPAGTVLDPSGIPISTAVDSQKSPSVAFGGGNYLVFWQSGDTMSYDIYATRVSPSGTVLDPSGIPICTATDNQCAPSVAFDGINYVIVWDDERSGSSSDIYGAKMNTSGVVIDSFAISLQSGDQITPALTHGMGDQMLITYSGWTDSINGQPVNNMRIWGKFHPFVGIEEGETSILEQQNLASTIFRGPLQLPNGKQCKVFAITGRVVEPSKIQPGIYFIEIDGVVTQKVVKVR